MKSIPLLIAMASTCEGLAIRSIQLLIDIVSTDEGRL